MAKVKTASTPTAESLLKSLNRMSDVLDKMATTTAAIDARITAQNVRIDRLEKAASVNASTVTEELATLRAKLQAAEKAAVSSAPSSASPSLIDQAKQILSIPIEDDSLTPGERIMIKMGIKAPKTVKDLLIAKLGGAKSETSILDDVASWISSKPKEAPKPAVDDSTSAFLTGMVGTTIGLALLGWMTGGNNQEVRYIPAPTQQH